MTRQTLAADVLDALAAAWRADATLTAYGSRLVITDGPPVTDRTHEIELWVGATGLEPDEAVVSGGQAFVTQNAADDIDETLNIACAIWVANGTNDIPTARRLAIDVFNAAVTAVQGSDLGLGDEVYDATAVVSWQLRQGQWTSGVGAVLAFVVQVQGQV